MKAWENGFKEKESALKNQMEMFWLILKIGILYVIVFGYEIEGVDP